MRLSSMGVEQECCVPPTRVFPRKKSAFLLYPTSPPPRKKLWYGTSTVAVCILSGQQGAPQADPRAGRDGPTRFPPRKKNARGSREAPRRCRCDPCRPVQCHKACVRAVIHGGASLLRLTGIMLWSPCSAWVEARAMRESKGL